MQVSEGERLCAMPGKRSRAPSADAEAAERIVERSLEDLRSLAAEVPAGSVILTCPPRVLEVSCMCRA